MDQSPNWKNCPFFHRNLAGKSVGNTISGGHISLCCYNAIQNSGGTYWPMLRKTAWRESEE